MLVQWVAVVVGAAERDVTVEAVAPSRLIPMSLQRSHARGRGSTKDVVAGHVVGTRQGRQTRSDALGPRTFSAEAARHLEKAGQGRSGTLFGPPIPGDQRIDAHVDGIRGQRKLSAH